VAFAQVSWEISTGNPAQAVLIGQALQQALAQFRPCFLLSDSVLFDTDDFSIDAIRRSLDGVALQFPTEFYYHSSEIPQGSGFMQGAYPRMAELARARSISGSPNSPFQRVDPLAAAPAGAAPRPMAGAAPRSRKTAARKTAARRKRPAAGKRRRPRGGSR
jgi:hypothetical protein